MSLVELSTQAVLSVIPVSLPVLALIPPPPTASIPVIVLQGPQGLAGGALTPVRVTANVTAHPGDAVYADATTGLLTVTLPAAGISRQVIVCKVDTSPNAVRVVDLSGVAVGDPVSVPQAASTYLADGINWRTVMAYTPGSATTATVTALKAGFLSNITAKTAAYTAAAGDYVMASTGTASFVVTSPALAAGIVVGVKKVTADANTVTFTPAAGTVDGATTFVINTFDAEYTFTCDGTNWQVS